MTDHYRLLGVARSATPEQIQAAFQERAMTVHPDRNVDNPDALQQFKELSHAYQVLSDHTKKAMYDQTLPPEEEIVTENTAEQAPQATPAISTDPANLREIWKKVWQLFYAQERYSKAMDGLRIVIPITIENETLIMGIDAQHSNLLGYINSNELAVKIRKILTHVVGQPLGFRVFNGTTIADWEVVKSSEALRKKRAESKGSAAMDSLLAANTEKNEDGTIAPAPVLLPPNLEEVVDRMQRAWGSIENRNLPQVRAKFLLDQIIHVVRSEEMMRANRVNEEVLQRLAAKAIDRLAILVGVDSAVVGLEYHRTKIRFIGGL